MANENLNEEQLENEEVSQGEASEGTEQGASAGEEDDKTTRHDEELEGAVDDEAREAIRARRRQERHDKKAAQREREESLRRELASRDTVINDLKQRLDVIDRKSAGSEVAQIDAAIKQSAEAYHYYKGQIASAIQAQDGVTASEATEQMIIAQRKYEELNNQKKAWQQNSQKPQPLDPRLANNARGFLERNNWYTPDGDDEDSDIARTVDKRLHKEGWDPTTPQYWDELEKRLQKRLPHRYKKMYNRDKGGSEDRPNTVSGSGRESAPSGNGGTFKLSREQADAIKDAGMWNDEEKRNRMIKRYKEQARANGQSN